MTMLHMASEVRVMAVLTLDKPACKYDIHFLFEKVFNCLGRMECQHNIKEKAAQTESVNRHGAKLVLLTRLVGATPSTQ